MLFMTLRLVLQLQLLRLTPQNEKEQRIRLLHCLEVTILGLQSPTSLVPVVVLFGFRFYAVCTHLVPHTLCLLIVLSLRASLVSACRCRISIRLYLRIPIDTNYICREEIRTHTVRLHSGNIRFFIFFPTDLRASIFLLLSIPRVTISTLHANCRTVRWNVTARLAPYLQCLDSVQIDDWRSMDR